MEKTMKKTGKGSLVGMAFGGLAGVIAASVIAVVAGVFVGFADGGLGAGLAVFLLYAFFGSIVGGTIGLVVGLVLGAVIAAAGLEDQARWVTPAVMVLLFALLGLGLARDIAPAELALTAIAALATIPLGWFAGRLYEGAMAPSKPPLPNSGGAENLPSANQLVR